MLHLSTSTPQSCFPKGSELKWGEELSIPALGPARSPPRLLPYFSSDGGIWAVSCHCYCWVCV